MMRETIPDKSQFPLFNVLFDRIVVFIFADFLFGVGPSWDFDDHVEDLGTCCGRRGKKRNIMPWRNNDTVLFKEDSVIERVIGAWLLEMLRG
jgi:hypothetical protein